MQVFSKNIWFLFGFIAILMAANISVYRAILAPRVLTIAVLEAGKGNAVLVHTPNGKTILIDTGPDASILRALGGALPPWQRRIDAVILTGTKNSLVGGLPEVESRYRVSTIMRAGVTAVPYGASLIFDGSRIEIIAPAMLFISYGATSLAVSSSTPAGVYISDGQTIMKTK